MNLAIENITRTLTLGIFNYFCNKCNASFENDKKGVWLS